MSLVTILKESYLSFTRKERAAFFASSLVVILAFIGQTAVAIHEKSELVPVHGGLYREGLIGQPIMINPVISSNQADLDISALIYSSLFDLAEIINTKDEERVYIVKLEEGLRWDNGEPLTSNDVIFTVRVVQDHNTNSHLRKNWQGIEVERISELQIEFTLPATPYAFFEDNLKNLPIIPEHIFGGIPPANLRLSAYNLEPVGSGSFKFEKLARSRDGFITSVTLSANEAYHKKRPFIKEMEFRFYQNTEELARAAEHREIHGFFLAVPEESGPIRQFLPEIIEIPALRYYTIFFNQNINSQLRNGELRRALAKAFDRSKILKRVEGAELISGPVLWNKMDLPEGMEAEINIPEYDPEGSREVIDRLKGEERWEIFLIVPEIGFLMETAEIIKEGWEMAGIDSVYIMPVETNYLMENVIRTRSYEALLFGNILLNPYDLFAFWHSSQRFHPGLNLFLYQNLEVDRKLENIRQTRSEEDRLEHLREAERIILRDQPAIFLFSSPYKYFQSGRLKGIEIGVISLPSERFKNVENWYIKEARVIGSKKEEN